MQREEEKPGSGAAVGIWAFSRGGVLRMRRKFSPEIELAIKRDYDDGQSLAQVAGAFGTSMVTVKRILGRHGGEIRPRSEMLVLRGKAKAKYSCDHAYFRDINTEDRAYWLGFLAADGCVSQRSENCFSLTLNLAEVDEAHVKAFRAAIQSQRPLAVVPAKTSFYKGRTIRSGAQTKLEVNSFELCQDLIRHGITPRKTFSLGWPEHLSDELLRHFLRGYADGDGSWQGLPEPHWAIVANTCFGSGAGDFVARSCGFIPQKMSLHHNPLSCTVARGGRFQVAKIAHLLYDGATIFLPRKREKIAALLS